MQTVALLAATVTAGLMAGVYGIFALAIMPGLRATDDRTFVAAFQAIDRAIVNPLFMLWFFGPLLFAGAAAALIGGEGSVLPWIAAALVLSLAVVVITFAVHLPLNDAIKAATGPRGARAVPRGALGGLERRPRRALDRRVRLSRVGARAATRRRPEAEFKTAKAGIDYLSRVGW